jgi:hypothetical protein
MRFAHRALFALAVVGAFNVSYALAQNQSGSGQSGQSGQQSQQSSQHNQTQQNQQKAPEGFVLIDERVVTLTANEPQNHFIRAHEYLTHGDAKAAAAETRIAAAYIDMQASRDNGNQGNSDLKSAADNLRSVAKQISSAAKQGQQGQTGSKASQSNTQGQASNRTQSNQQSQTGQRSGSTVGQTGNVAQGQFGQYDTQLTQAFAQANKALAEHFQSQAKRELQQNKSFMAGYDLDAAASALQSACAWSSSKQIDQNVLTVVQDAHRAAMRLISPNMTDQEWQANNPSSNTQQQNGEAEAQPAAAKISPSDQSQTGQGNVTQQETQAAQKALNELDKAIQSLPSSSQNGSTGSSTGGNSSSGSSGQNK